MKNKVNNKKNYIIVGVIAGLAVLALILFLTLRTEHKMSAAECQKAYYEDIETFEHTGTMGESYPSYCWNLYGDPDTREAGDLSK